MAADLFETYVVTVGATMVLTALLLKGLGAALAPMMALPLLIGGVCIVTSIIGTYFVKLGFVEQHHGARCTRASLSPPCSLSVAIWWAISYALGDMETPMSYTILDNTVTFSGRVLFYCSLLGLVITGPDHLDHRVLYRHQLPPRCAPSPSRRKPGHGTNVIQGLAISLESTAMPTIVICAGIIIAYQLAGLIGIAYAATAMLALAGMVVALDAYGPVTDNAGGIAEMAGLDDSVRGKDRRARCGGATPPRP